jgi:hypothetical protein
MKKAVFYLEPTIRDGVEGYIIRDWKNVLSWKQLPYEYNMKFPCFAENRGYIEISNKGRVYFIFKDMFVSTDSWNECYRIMRQAGQRLSDILHKPKIIKVEI